MWRAQNAEAEPGASHDEAGGGANGASSSSSSSSSEVGGEPAGGQGCGSDEQEGSGDEEEGGSCEEEEEEPEGAGGLPGGSESLVSILTADFSMQNVILQMGLRLATPDGRRVSSLSRWVLRCTACFAVTKASRLHSVACLCLIVSALMLRPRVLSVLVHGCGRVRM